MKKLLIAVLAAVALYATPAFAYTLASDGVVVGLSSKEPTSNTDASAITNLVKIRYYWKLGAAGQEFFVDVPATVATGGGTNAGSVKVPVTPCSKGGILSVQATAWNPTTESARTTAVTLTIADRTGECIPNAPTVLTVQ